MTRRALIIPLIILSISGFLANSYAADTSPPIIDQIISPSSAQPGDRISLYWRVSDDVSIGLVSNSIPFTNFYLFKGTQLVKPADGNSLRTTGDNKIGTYTSSVTIPQGALGEFRVEIYAYDGIGNLVKSSILLNIVEISAEVKAAAELKARQEAEAKAAAELKAKQESEAKAAAEQKAKQEAEAAAELKVKKEAEAKAAAELKAKQEADAKAAAELKAKQETEAKAAADKAALTKAQSDLSIANAALADAQKVNREQATRITSFEEQFKGLSESVTSLQNQLLQFNSKLTTALAGQKTANAKLKKVCSAKPKPKGC
jgi:Tfp pilus assembly protein FimV